MKKLDKLLFHSAIFILLFFGNNVLNFFGFSPTSLLTTILPSFYIIFLFCIKHFFKPYCCSVYSKRYELILFVIIFLLLIIQIYKGSSGFAGTIINMLLLPVLFSYLYPEYNEKFKITSRNLLTYFYIINSLWSIGERIIGKNIFPFTGLQDPSAIIYSLLGFRSTALQDHPLNNALCLTSIVVFILMSSYYTLRNKIILFLLGYFAIFCFNTRSSMVLWAVIFIIFLFNVFFSRRNNVRFITKFRFTIFILLMIPVFFYIIQTYQLGDRLMNQDLLDDSALVRIESMTLFLKSDFMSILWGLSDQRIEILMYRANIQIIENFWIIFFFNYGLVGLSLLILGFFLLFRHLFTCYSRFQTLFIVGTFFLLASTNNSLAVYGQPLTIFIICCLSYSGTNYSSKYIRKRIYR